MKSGALRLISLLSGLIFLLPTLGLTGCVTQADPMELHLYAFSMGKADCLLLSYDGYHVLIDTGEEDDGEDIAQELSSLGIEKIGLLILTHFDKDHIGGLPELLEHIEVEACLRPGYVRDSKKYRAMEEALEVHNVPVQELTADTGLTLGRGSFLFWTSTVAYDTEEKNDNELSMVTRFTYGDCSYVFMGDAEGQWLSDLCYKGYDITCDVLKVPHHGEWDASTGALAALSLPQFALITDSKKNPADEQTLSAFRLLGANTLCTAEGTIHLTSDGQRVWMDAPAVQ